ncbi:MAG: PilZ domain-containing protein [Caulobacterales bacterium]
MTMPKFTNPFTPKKSQTVPTHRRRDVRLNAGLVLLPREISVNGVILNVSEGGCLFRPLLSHLISRTGDPVIIDVAGVRILGRVMNTNVRGYGVAFDELIDPAMFDGIVQTDRSEHAEQPNETEQSPQAA